MPLAPPSDVEPGHQRNRSEALAVYGHRRALLEVDLDIGGLVRRFFRRNRQLEHVLVRLVPGILQDAALKADMEQVFVGTVGIFLGHRHRDIVFLGISDQFLPGVQVPDPPGGDDRQFGIERQVGQFETDLIVALAGGSMADAIGPFGSGDPHLFLGDQRPGKRSPQQVGAFVDGVGAEGRENVIADKLLAQVGNDHLFRAGGQALGPDLPPSLPSGRCRRNRQ
jgi:hypothetical protein